MYYKLGQACVTNWGSFFLSQIRANVVTNCDSFSITNWGKCCYKLGQLLQIRTTVITKQGSYYKLGKNLLQIGAGISNQGNYYKLGHNTRFVSLHVSNEIHQSSARFIHSYPTRLFNNSFTQPKAITKSTSFVLSSSELKIRNNYQVEMKRQFYMCHYSAVNQEKICFSELQFF